MKAIPFACPRCQAPQSAGPDESGRLLVCSSCYGPILFPDPDDPGSPVPRRWSSLANVGGSSLVVLIGFLAVVGWSRSRTEVRPEPTPAVALAVVAPIARPQLVAAPEPPPVPTIVSEPEISKPLTSDPNRPLVIRRRQILGQEALRKQLAMIPELAADEGTEAGLIALHKVPPVKMAHSPAAALTPTDRAALRRAALQNRDQRRAAAPPEPGAGSIKPAMRVAQGEAAPRGMLAMIVEKQPELASLAWRMGDECHLDRESAEDLQALSRALRNVLVKVTPEADTRPDADKLRAALLEEPGKEAKPAPEETPQKTQANTARPKFQARFLCSAAIPALMQLLLAERTPVRLVLSEILERIDGPVSTRSLARLAVFDLAPEVRERALMALRSRPVSDYRPFLIESLRFPWAPAADHAAEALVALQDREAVSALIGLLGQPDPQSPRTEIREGRPVTLTRSLVQVNHLSNCVMCHAPSANPTSDMVRGRVPDESQPLPPAVEYYASNSPGLFVKAEVTYLRQDFSATQPVANSGPWPAYQRYDYLVTDRPSGDRKLRDRGSKDRDQYPQRESVLFALRELTGQDLGTSREAWKDLEIVKPSE